jgi:ribonuclease VapC
MVLDTSALLAILFREEGYEDLLEEIRRAHPRKVAAPTLAEAGIVLGARLGFERVYLLLALLSELQAEVIPFSEAHAREAISAYRRYGRGRHPAGLNFGDCLSYALAKVEGEPLLYKGEDFDQTDLAWKPS